MDSPDILKFRRGGGCLMLFGAPFFFMGLLFFVMAFKGKVHTESGDPAQPWQVALFSIPFMAVGAAFMFGRMGVTINRRAGSVVSWWGLLGPLRSKRRELEDFSRVSLTRKIIRSDKSTRIVFPVCLDGKGGPVECEQAADYAAARRSAEKLSKFTGFDLYDSAEGEAIVREAKYLDESVAERAKRLGVGGEWPELPEGSRIEYETVGESAVIRLPPPGFQWLYMIMFVPALIFVIFFLSTFAGPFLHGSSNLTGVGRWLVGAFLSLFVVIPLASLAMAAWKGSVLRETVAASWQGIRIERKGWLGTRKWTFRAKEIEEISVTRPRLSLAGLPGSDRAAKLIGAVMSASASRGASGIRLCSDKTVCSFGSSLSGEELDWMEQVLTYILANSPET